MLYFLSQNKKILLVAVSILIVSVSFVLLLFGDHSGELKADSLFGGEEGDGEVKEASIEGVQNSYEVFDAR